MGGTTLNHKHLQSGHEIFIKEIYFNTNLERFTKFLNHKNLDFVQLASWKYRVNKYHYRACKCNFIVLALTHADLEPYLLIADDSNDTIYHSNLDGRGVRQLVLGLPDPFALDFDYRYSAIC